MRIRRPIAIGHAFGHPAPAVRATLLAALCAALLLAGGALPESEHTTAPLKYGIWKKSIKRLKLADPESTETMFA